MAEPANPKSAPSGPVRLRFCGFPHMDRYLGGSKGALIDVGINEIFEVSAEAAAVLLLDFAKAGVSGADAFERAS